MAPGKKRERCIFLFFRTSLRYVAGEPGDAQRARGFLFRCLFFSLNFSCTCEQLQFVSHLLRRARQIFRRGFRVHCSFFVSYKFLFAFFQFKFRAQFLRRFTFNKTDLFGEQQFGSE